jgi:N-methylhydantoinase A
MVYNFDDAGQGPSSVTSRGGPAAPAVGVDVGGTFTDLIALDTTGTVEILKVPTTPERPSDGVLAGLARLAAHPGPNAPLAHGTTIVTNAIAERRFAQTALITTRGFRDVLEIARQNRTHLYHLAPPAKPEPLVPRRLRLEVHERLDADGNVLVPLDVEDVPRLVEHLRREGVDSVAVCLLHGYANPAHERALGHALAPHVAHVSLGSAVNAEFREYERTTTTVLNAAVQPLAARYLDALLGALRASYGAVPLHLLQSNGGMMSVAAAKAKPLTMAVSGPAAGVAAAASLARSLGLDRALAFDMGGTTTDVCLIADGQAETASERRLGGHPVRLPSVAVESIGAGGGSIASVDSAGALRVGPRSAGALPGPACYGRGGAEPTVTDANLLLGYVGVEHAYGGGVIRLDPARAEAAVARLADALAMRVADAASGIVEVANASMLRALRLVSVQRGHDLRDFALVAYGGAGPLHAGRLARELAIPRVVVPAFSGAFSALGCLVSDLRYDGVRTYRASLQSWDPKAVRGRLHELEEDVVAPLLGEGYAPADLVIRRELDLRYKGQNYELTVPLASEEPEVIRASFEARHRQLYGYATGETVECVNLRVSASAPRGTTEMPRGVAASRDGSVHRRSAYFPECGRVDIAVHDRGALEPDRIVHGPAVIEDEWSTTIVYPGQRCHADGAGNLVIECAP